MLALAVFIEPKKVDAEFMERVAAPPPWAGISMLPLTSGSGPQGRCRASCPTASGLTLLHGRYDRHGDHVCVGLAASGEPLLRAVRPPVDSPQEHPIMAGA